MQETREPQASHTETITPRPTYPLPYPTAPSSLVIQASARTRFWRFGRLLLRRLLRGLFIGARAIRPFAGMLVVVLLLLSVIGWMSYQLWAPREDALPPPAFQRVESLPPTAAIETYLKGQQNYNADMMWSSYSPDFQAAQLAHGASKDTLQAIANRIQQTGIQFAQADYIGGVEIEDGSMYFYTIDLVLANRHRHFSYVFTADANGQIVNVDSPFLRAFLESL